jgi:hypothetical protein
MLGLLRDSLLHLTLAHDTFAASHARRRWQYLATQKIASSSPQLETNKTIQA